MLAIMFFAKYFQKVVDVVKSSNLDYMIDLKNRLDIAYNKQYLSVEKSTDLNYLIRGLELELFELKSRKDRLLPQLRNSNMASRREKIKGFNDISKKHSDIAILQSSELSEMNKEIAQKTAEIEAANEEIEVVSRLCTDELANYMILKEEYELLSTGNDEWNNWCASRTEALKDLAEQAMIPQRLYDTVVAIPDEKGGVRLYFGNKDKVYTKKSMCRILTKDGTVLHQENNKVGVVKKH